MPVCHYCDVVTSPLQSDALTVDERQAAVVLKFDGFDAHTWRQLGIGVDTLVPGGVIPFNAVVSDCSCPVQCRTFAPPDKRPRFKITYI